MTDFWPEGITLEDAQSPEDILVAAKEQWRTKSGGILGLVIQETTLKEYAMLAIYARHEPTNRTVNLFRVIHRQKAPYPVTIQPEEDELPNILKKSYYSPSFGDIGNLSLVVKGMSEGRTVENQWVADSPGEFRDQLKKVFNLGSVKANVLALVAGGPSTTHGTGDLTKGARESTGSERDSTVDESELPKREQE